MSEDFSQRNEPSLLFAFSAVCHYSKTNWPNWVHIISRRPNVDVVFADITGLSSIDFFHQLGVPIPEKIIKTDPLFNQTFNVHVTPTTILLGPHGLVRRVFVGVMDDAQVKELLSDLGPTN